MVHVGYWVAVAYLKPSRTSMIEIFAKIIKSQKPLTILAEKLNHRCSNEF